MHCICDATSPSWVGSFCYVNPSYESTNLKSRAPNSEIGNPFMPSIHIAKKEAQLISMR